MHHMHQVGIHTSKYNNIIRHPTAFRSKRSAIVQIARLSSGLDDRARLPFENINFQPTKPFSTTNMVLRYANQLLLHQSKQDEAATEQNPELEQPTIS